MKEQLKKPKVKTLSPIDENHISMFKELTEYMDINYSVMDTKGNIILTNTCFDKRFPQLNEISNLDVWQHCKQVMKSGKRVTIEEEYEGKVYLSVKQPIIKKGKCKGVMILSFDITAQKQAEIAKIRILDNLRHDLNTPFTGMVTVAKMLEKDEKDPKRKQYLSLISESAESLLSLLRKVLEVVKIDDPEEFKESLFNIKEATEKVISMDKAAAYAKGLKIDLECEDKTISGQKFNFDKILLNLVSNAIKFTEKGKISVNVKVEKEKLKISVKDTGIGIDKKNHEFIFEGFSRVKNSYQEPKFNGCGLGLYNVKKIVEKMNGKIKLASSLGKGSNFEVILPISEST